MAADIRTVKIERIAVNGHELVELVDGSTYRFVRFYGQGPLEPKDAACLAVALLHALVQSGVIHEPSDVYHVVEGNLIEAKKDTTEELPY